MYYSPVRHSPPKRCVRLACIRHAASVHPEPGSNSPLSISKDNFCLLALLCFFLLTCFLFSFQCPFAALLPSAHLSCRLIPPFASLFFTFFALFYQFFEKRWFNRSFLNLFFYCFFFRIDESARLCPISDVSADSWCVGKWLPNPPLVSLPLSSYVQQAGGQGRFLW